jgi:ParB-like chromosome segregation protein Spo0J
MGPLFSAQAISVQIENSPQLPSFEDYQIVNVVLAQLDLNGSPRLSGVDPEHTRVLAEVRGSLPPITVHGPTMRVIDGTHRTHAALLNGERTIAARLIDCDERTAFVLAVKENITHGLPLSTPDRKAAAANIIASHPEWSDRTIAEATGVSDKTVSAIRSGTTSESPQSSTRLGKDGRLRPLNSASMRKQAASIIREHPHQGLREIARATGLSPATVRDVRERLNRNEDPVPERYREAVKREFEASPRQYGALIHAEPVDRRKLLAKLTTDPSLKFSEAGRNMLWWLHKYSVDLEACEGMAISIPEHWSMPVAALARNCAQAWMVLATQLEERYREGEQPEDATAA